MTGPRWVRLRFADLVVGDIVRGDPIGTKPTAWQVTGRNPHRVAMRLRPTALNGQAELVYTDPVTEFYVWRIEPTTAVVGDAVIVAGIKFTKKSDYPFEVTAEQFVTDADTDTQEVIEQEQQRHDRH